MKPAIVAILEQYLQNRITSKHTGRKRQFDLNLFLDAVYQLLDNADKSVWLKKSNTEVAGSYKRYLRHLKASNEMNIIFERSLENEPEPFAKRLVSSLLIVLLLNQLMATKELVQTGQIELTKRLAKWY